MCIVLKCNAIRRVIKFVTQFLECLDRKVGKIYKYVKRRQRGLILDMQQKNLRSASFRTLNGKMTTRVRGMVVVELTDCPTKYVSDDQAGSEDAFDWFRVR